MIVCIGEVVWDIFGDKKVLGGAPINVAYHLNSLGVEVKIVTRVGKDALGKETKDKLQELGLSLEGVQEGDLPTGRVHVTIGADNEPNFDIVAPAAWDAIVTDEAVNFLRGRPFQLVFGTLAQRDERSRRTIRRLWDMAETCMYDVNLRPPFTTKKLVLDSLKAADMVKMNSDEFGAISLWHSFSSEDKKAAAQKLLETYEIAELVVTEGENGSWLITKDDYFSHPGVAVNVADTVGAGDAFFATLIEGYVNNRSWRETLARADQRGAYVASQNGATPPMPE